MPRTPAKYEDRRCQTCGKIFNCYIIPARPKSGKYCSLSCAYVGISKSMKKLWADGLIIKRSWRIAKDIPFVLVDSCPQCGGEFYPGYQRDMTCGIYCEDCHTKHKVK